VRAELACATADLCAVYLDMVRHEAELGRVLDAGARAALLTQNYTGEVAAFLTAWSRGAGGSENARVAATATRRLAADLIGDTRVKDAVGQALTDFITMCGSNATRRLREATERALASPKLDRVRNGLQSLYNACSRFGYYPTNPAVMAAVESLRESV